MSEENKFEAELQDRAAAEAKIAARAMEDEDFRAKLLADPKAAVAEATGLEFPAEVNIVVHEETADTLHMVIPPAIPDELTDDQLEAVAGGAVFAGATAKAVGLGIAGGAASGATAAGVKKASSGW